MKKTLLLLSALAFNLGLSAQYTLDISGVATNEDGPVAGLAIYIHSEGSVIMPGDTIDVVYTDENGEFESFSEIEDPAEVIAVYTGAGCDYYNVQQAVTYPFEHYYEITCNADEGGNTGGGDGGGDPTGGDGPNSDCFEVVLPVDVTLPNGNVETISDQSFFDDVNLQTVQFVYPFEILFYDDSSTMVLESPNYLFLAMQECEDTELECAAVFYHGLDSVADGIVYFINESEGEDLSYFWDFGDGATSTEQYPTHTFESETDEYEVCLTVSNEDCESTLCVYVSGLMDGDGNSGISTGGHVVRHNTAKSDGFEFVVIPADGAPLKIENPALEVEMALFPNPSQGQITIQLDEAADLDGVISIVDLGGRIIFQTNVNQSKTVNLDLTTVPEGIYVVQFSGNNTTAVQKIVLQ